MNSKKWAGLLALVLVILSVVFWHGRFSADFWPLDASRVGPNLVASVIQWAIIALVVYLAYPPIRKAIDAAVKAKGLAASKLAKSLKGAREQLEKLRPLAERATELERELARTKREPEFL